MDQDQEKPPIPTRKEFDTLRAEVKLLSRESRAQALLLRALLATHPDLQAVAEEFETQKERLVSSLLAANTTDAGLAAEEFVLDRWLETIRTGVAYQARHAKD